MEKEKRCGGEGKENVWKSVEKGLNWWGCINDAMASDIPNITLIVLNACLVVANFILAYAAYSQSLDSRKPVFIIKLLSGQPRGLKFGQENPEKDPQYFTIKNDSDNPARKLDIKITLNFDQMRVLIKRSKLSVLNPHEGLKILFALKMVIDKYPDLFEQREFKKNGVLTILKIPKETLKIKVDLSLKWHPNQSQIDSYYIEWGSLKEYPDINSHPVINSWNKRDGEYIYKLKN